MELTKREKEIIIDTWTKATKDVNEAALLLFKQYVKNKKKI